MHTETKRVLIGWTEINPVNLLAGADPQALKPEHHQKVQQAEAAKNSRPTFNSPTNVITEPSIELNEYVKGFWAQPNMQVFIQEGGWSIKMVDLKKVCTIQPVVEATKSKERVLSANSKDLVSVAKITLPYATTQGYPGAFDASKNAFIFSSPNPNLRIAGTVANNGAFGFVVMVSDLFVQVAKCNGRYFLRDGHHRSYGLMANGISSIPVLYKEYNSFSQMNIPPGIFPMEVLASPQPPMLTDFFNDDVSSEAQFAISTKVVMIQAIEVGTIAA